MHNIWNQTSDNMEVAKVIHDGVSDYPVSSTNMIP